MSFIVEVHPLVSSDINEASHWYSSRRKDLGQIFEEHAFSSMEKIKDKPLLNPVKYHQIRTRRISKKFPYFIHYEVIKPENKILVYAIFHGKQNPKRWSERLSF